MFSSFMNMFPFAPYLLVLVTVYYGWKFLNFILVNKNLRKQRFNNVNRLTGRPDMNSEIEQQGSRANAPVYINKQAFWAGMTDLCETIKIKSPKKRTLPNGQEVFTEEEFNKIVYPDLVVNSDGDVVMTFSSKINKNKLDRYANEIIKRLMHYKLINKELCEVLETSLPYEFIFKGFNKKKLIFNGAKIDDNLELWQKTLRDIRSNKTTVFIGESFIDNEHHDRDTNFFTIDLATSPHMMVIGQSRSGKTKTVLSYLASIAYQYPETQLLFADGKGSPDYDVINMKKGVYEKVAKLGGGEQPLLEIANVIEYAYARYEANKVLFTELLEIHGKSASSLVEYNNFVPKVNKGLLDDALESVIDYLENEDEIEAEKKLIHSEHDRLITCPTEYNKMIKTINQKIIENNSGLPENERKKQLLLIIPRLFLVIDEFAEIATKSSEKLDVAMGAKNGNIWLKLKLLGSGGASFGINLVLASQRAQNDSFPTPLSSNLGTRLLHRVGMQDENFLNQPGQLQTLERGTFKLIHEDYRQIDGRPLTCRLPYIGDNSYFLESLPDNENRIPFDQDLIYTDSSRSDENESAIQVRKKFKYILKEFSDIEETIFGTYRGLKCSILGQEYNILFVDGSLVNGNTAVSRIDSSFGQGCQNKLMVLTGAAQANKESGFLKAFSEAKIKVAFPTEYRGLFELIFRRETTGQALVDYIEEKFTSTSNPVAQTSGKDFYNSRAWRELRYRILVEQGKKCANCKVTGEHITYHVDHIKPRSLYPELALEPSNMQVLCEDCNLGKSNKWEIDHRNEGSEKKARVPENLSKEERKQMARKLLKEGKMDYRQIGEIVGLGKSTVGNVKKEMDMEEKYGTKNSKYGTKSS